MGGGSDDGGMGVVCMFTPLCMCWQRSPLKQDGCMCMCVYLCVCGGGVSRQEGQTVQPQGKLPPKSRSLHSTRTLVLCDGKARRGGVGGERLCHRE